MTMRIQGTCGSCRFWLKERRDYHVTVESRSTQGGDWESEESEADELDRLYGHCDKIEMGPAHPDEVPPALVLDGSGYKADLFTRAEFSCSLWQAVE